MEASTWAWGTACQEPTIPEHQLPADRLVFKNMHPNGSSWVAYKRGRYADGGVLPPRFYIGSASGIHFVHYLQWVRGFGPLYWKEPGGEYYKVDLFLIENNEEKLDQRIGMEIFRFDPTDL
jgi:hypothetical protein